MRPPFEGEDQLQLIHRIENEPPVPPRQIERGIPRDLETIVLKALAKNPNDRFATAEEMAAELRRFVENRPIRSRPIPFYQQFWRWCKRNPGLAGANIAAATLTTVLAIVSTVAAWTYREPGRNQVRRSETRGAARSCFEALRCSGPSHAVQPAAGPAIRQPRGPGQAAAIGQELKLPPERFDPLRDEAIACLALPDLRADGRVITRPSGVIAVCLRLHA